jgi:hypothetical protein
VAISDNQVQSVTIGCNQVQSVASVISSRWSHSRLSVASRLVYMQSVAISGNQWQSVAISGERHLLKMATQPLISGKPVGLHAISGNQ